MHRITERTIRTLAEQTGIAPARIKDEHRLHEDLQCDSLDTVECMMALEEEFGIEIDEAEFEKLQTVQQIISYIEDVCKNTRQTPPVAESATMKALIVAEDFLRGYEHEPPRKEFTEMQEKIRAAIREEQQRTDNVAELVKVTTDLLCEVDALKNNAAPLSTEEQARISQIVERSHDALEALGVKYNLDEPAGVESNIDRATRLVGTRVEVLA
jgi:acyl carrier protein